MSAPAPSFDPWAIIGALERNDVDYVLIGGLAQVLRGSDIVTTGVDVCPSFAKGNLERLNAAIGEVTQSSGKRTTLDETVLSERPVVVVRADPGTLKVIASPTGIPNGYVALRRAARREELGRGLRPLVASSGDLAAMAAALGREQDRERLAMLRRIVELEVSQEPSGLGPRRPGRERTAEQSHSARR
jgi:hypothetical protein